MPNRRKLVYYSTIFVEYDMLQISQQIVKRVTGRLKVPPKKTKSRAYLILITISFQLKKKKKKQKPKKKKVKQRLPLTSPHELYGLVIHQLFHQARMLLFDTKEPKSASFFFLQ